MKAVLSLTARKWRRGTEVVEGVLRHHIGACFAALERRVLDLLHKVLPRLKSFEAAKKKPMPGSQQTHPLVEVALPVPLPADGMR